MWTSIFEWCVVRCGSKNGHHKGIMCLKEIGVSAQNMLNHSRLNSQHNWGGLYDHSMSMRIFTVIVKMIFI